MNLRDMTDPRNLPCPSSHRYLSTEEHADAVLAWLSASVAATEADPDRSEHELWTLEKELRHWHPVMKDRTAEAAMWVVIARGDGIPHAEETYLGETFRYAERMRTIDDLDRRVRNLRLYDEYDPLPNATEAERLAVWQRLDRIRLLHMRNDRDLRDMDNPEREYFEAQAVEDEETRRCMGLRQNEVRRLEDEIDAIMTVIAQRKEAAA